MWDILFAIFILFYIYTRVGSERLPVLGIYQTPAKWFYLKQWFIYLAIKLNKRKGDQGVGHSNAGYGLKANSDHHSMESPQVLGEHPLSVDAVWFGGANKEGMYLVISGARRKQRVMQSMLFLYVPGIGLLQSKKHPETAIFQTEAESAGWEGDGILLKMVEPLKKWIVRFQGEMVAAKNGKVFKVNLDCAYTTNLKHFDFDSDMNPWTVARAMAREPWSREYFQRMRAAHQNHYEQFGQLTGQLTVDKDSYKVDLEVMKDHTHGSVRDWRLMHRYAFHQFTTVSGLRGFLGIVSQPGTLSFLELGWVLKDGKPLPVQDVDFKIWNFGEGGQDTPDYGFRFKAGDEWFNVQVRQKYNETGKAFYGWEWEARIVEKFCRYTINGEEGWGVSEWEYRHTGGRPQEVSDLDPTHIVKDNYD